MTVLIADEFDPEVQTLPKAVQDGLFAMVRVLQQFGPQLGRPHGDTLKNSKHANMKKLRFDAANGVWRVAFRLRCETFRRSTRRWRQVRRQPETFYRELIRNADQRFDAHLERIRKQKT